MRKIRLISATLVPAVAVAYLSCGPSREREANLECSRLTTTFFRKPLKVQITEFNRSDIRDQYVIFICGNQHLEPPAIYLAPELARRGAVAVSLLKAELASAKDDLTIRDIVVVLAAMSRQGTYDVRSDSDLMRVMSGAVGAMQDADWKRMCVRMLAEIRTGNADHSLRTR